MRVKIQGFEVDIFVNDNGALTLEQPRHDGSGETDAVQIGRSQLAEVIEELTRLKNDPDAWHVVESANKEHRHTS